MLQKDGRWTIRFQSASSGSVQRGYNLLALLIYIHLAYSTNYRF